jgi:hypothetical protein
MPNSTKEVAAVAKRKYRIEFLAPAIVDRGTAFVGLKTLATEPWVTEEILRIFPEASNIRVLITDYATRKKRK